MRKEIWEYQKYRALIKNMGKPETVPLTAEYFAAISTGGLDSYESDTLSVIGLHPVFLLAEHFSSDDGEYYEGGSYLKLGNRGDSMVIPAYGEDGEVYFLSIAFHKGDGRFGITYFPERKEEMRDKLLEILNQYETR
jgi:hypothetical protein